MPDFNTLHMCRDFDAVVEWNNKKERTIQWNELRMDWILEMGNMLGGELWMYAE